MARETPQSTWNSIDVSAYGHGAPLDKAPDLTSLFTQEAPANLLDESVFGSRSQRYGHGQNTQDDDDEGSQADFSIDVWEQVRQATRATLGETSAILKAASPAKPRQSSKELPPLVPSRRSSLLPKPTQALQRSQTASRLPQRQSTQPHDLRRSILQRSTSTTALPSAYIQPQLPPQPPRSAMKSKSTLSRSVNKSVAFAPVQPDISQESSHAREEQQDESVAAATRPDSPALPLPSIASTSKDQLNHYAKSVFAPASPRPLSCPPSALASPQITLAQAPQQDDSFLPEFHQHGLLQQTAPRSTVTSTPKPGRQFIKPPSAQREEQREPLDTSRHALQDLNLSNIEAGSSNSSRDSSASTTNRYSIADLTASVARDALNLSRSRDALDRAMRSLQAQPSSLGLGPPPTSRVCIRSTPPASSPAIPTVPDRTSIMSPELEERQQTSAQSLAEVDAPQITSSRRMSVGVQAGEAAFDLHQSQEPSYMQSHVQTSQERSWSEPSLVDYQPPSVNDDMFHRRLRDSNFHSGLDFKKPAPGVVHSVTGYQLPPGRPVVHLPPPSFAAGRAVRPNAKIIPDLHRSDSAFSAPPKSTKPTLTLPREFNFHKTRPRVPSRRDDNDNDSRPNKRAKLGVSAAFAPPIAATNRRVVSEPQHKPKHAKQPPLSTSRYRKHMEAPEAHPLESERTQSALTSEALQQQQSLFPTEEAHRQDDRISHYLDSIGQIDPAELDSPRHNYRPIVSLPASRVASDVPATDVVQNSVSTKNTGSPRQSQPPQQRPPTTTALGDKTNKGTSTVATTDKMQAPKKTVKAHPFTFHSDLRAARQARMKEPARVGQSERSKKKDAAAVRIAGMENAPDARRLHEVPVKQVPRGEGAEARPRKVQTTVKPFNFTTGKRRRAD